MDFTGKVCLITGGTKGIGKATASAYVKLGANVVITYAGDASAAEATVKELGGESRALAVQSDAADIAGLDKLVSAAVEKFGRIDVVIPNAAYFAVVGLQQTTEEQFDMSFKVNVKSPYFLIQKCLPHMSRGSAVILLSTSQCAQSTVTAPYLLYCSTKGAIEQINRVLAKELAPKGIRVNCVAPGPTDTALFRRGKSDELINKIANLTEWARLGQPEEIAETIVYLSSDKASWTDGQIVRVNGGTA